MEDAPSRLGARAYTVHRGARAAGHTVGATGLAHKVAGTAREGLAVAQKVGRLGEQHQALVRVDDVLEERSLLFLALALTLPSSLDAPDIQSRHVAATFFAASHLPGLSSTRLNVPIWYQHATYWKALNSKVNT